MNCFKKIMIGTACCVVLTAPFSFPTFSEDTTVKAAGTTCKVVNQSYPYGVSKKAGIKNKIVSPKTKKVRYEKSKAYVSAKLYKKYSNLDRDKDGIACEK